MGGLCPITPFGSCGSLFTMLDSKTLVNHGEHWIHRFDNESDRLAGLGSLSHAFS